MTAPDPLFTGLSAFPLTPLREDRVDLDAFGRIVARLAEAGVDSVTALGSTGSYAYLNRAERRQVVATAVERAGSTPVFAGVGALRTSEVLEHVADAEDAGAAALLLAPVSYQPLREREVLELFRTVLAATDLPVILYDNPTTTGFRFTDELYARIAETEGLASIKIPGVPPGPSAAAGRVRRLREMLPEHVSIGISGDPMAMDGLRAGCDLWYSVLGGTLPDAALTVLRAARSGNPETMASVSAWIEPMWRLFATCGGSLRVMAAVAEELCLVTGDPLPRPLLGLTREERADLGAALEALGVLC